MRRPLTPALLLLALAAPVLPACGQDGAEGDVARTLSTRLVDLGAQPPFVNAFAVHPADGSYLLTTNKGFFRIAADGGSVRRLRSSVSAPGGGSAPVGTFLAFFIDSADGRTLIGSGHPDTKRTKLPQFLGTLRSADGGRTWKVISRLGIADLHVIRRAGAKLYAFDAVLGLMLSSTDGGRTWAEHAAPRGQLLADFVVDPADDRHLVAAAEDGIWTSADGGRTWRPGEPVAGARFAWPEAGALYRATADGEVSVSKNSGRSFEPVGKLTAEPWRMQALDARTLVVAEKDGAIERSQDGGRTWKLVFEP